MAQLNKRFGKYDVTLDNNMGDGATGCWIEHKARSGKEYNASLQCAQDFGQLECFDDGATHDIEQAILDDIEQWALENGY